MSRPVPLRPLTFTSLVLLAFLWTLDGVQPASVEAQQADDETLVMAVVITLFDGMRARDGAMVGSAFHAEARLMTTGTTPDGTPRVQIQPIEGFIRQMGEPGPPLDEQIFNPRVEIDGGLAHVWVDYTLHVGGEFSHCGVDSIQLARTSDGWKILSVADTRRQEGCEPLLQAGSPGVFRHPRGREGRGRDLNALALAPPHRVSPVGEPPWPGCGTGSGPPSSAQSDRRGSGG